MTATIPNRPTQAAKLPYARSENGRRPDSDAAEALQDELRSRIKGEVRFDAVSRVLYSTDASNYQVEPVGVVIPASIDDVLATIEIARLHRVPLLPRGGGSSLAGQTVGAALVIDFSKALANVLSVDVEARTVTVEPGINIDALNRQLKSSGLMFGPDPASTNRATAGGVVGNNSTGSHSILYGMTSDNVRSVNAVLADGSLIGLGPTSPAAMAGRAAVNDAKGRLFEQLLAFRDRYGGLIVRDFLLTGGVPRAIRSINSLNLMTRSIRLDSWFRRKARWRRLRRSRSSWCRDRRRPGSCSCSSTSWWHRWPPRRRFWRLIRQRSNSWVAC